MSIVHAVFNNSSGNDGTAATSGAPSTLTPVTGTAAAHTGGASSTTITLTNSPDLSAVPTDGTALVRLNTASGRKWSRILGVDNGAKTLTTQDAFNIALASAVDYAIGGKRSSLDAAANAQLYADLKAGWCIEVEYTGTDYTISSKKSITTSGNGELPIFIHGTGATRPTISGSHNGAHFALPRFSGARFLRFITSNGTNTATAAIEPGGDSFNNTIQFFHDNIVEGLAYGCTNGGFTGVGIIAIGNTFSSLANYAFNRVGGNYTNFVVLMNNKVTDCDGLFDAGGGSSPTMFIACFNTIDTPALNAISSTAASEFQPILIFCNTFYAGASGDFINWTDPGLVVAIFSNIFKNSAGYDVDDSTWGDLSEWAMFRDFNLHQGFTLGDYQTSFTESNGQSTDPLFTDAAGGDFSLGSSSPAKGAGWPQTLGALTGTRDSHPDIGADQREESAGGGEPGNLMGGIFQ